ncbi:MAG: hypothetical protein Q8M92_07555 [Candidatus Subteraquimicrobiales bacterium]|nr:hypothetical protein [Candidatus Subteraquimicrobiales bacterium]
MGSISRSHEIGGFKGIDEIKKVKGIGSAKFEKIKDMIIIEEMQD